MANCTSVLELLGDKDRAKAGRVLAMMKMKNNY
jgi:hypothetical protein